jgi:hypothetical protein
MRIRLTSDRSGAFGVQYEGDILDIPDGEAAAIVMAGQADRLDEPIEAAAVTAPENAMRSKPKRR